MNGIKRYFFGIAVILVLCFPVDSVGDLRTSLQNIANSHHLRGSDFGLAVYDTSSSSYLIRKGSSTPLIPASNQKLLVTSACMLEMKPGFRFRTRIYYGGTLKDGVLEGALVIRAGGDPNISKRCFKADYTGPIKTWVEQIYNRGLRKINGPILIDDSIYDREFFHPSWPQKQAHKWYAAQIGALSCNDNCIEMEIKPGNIGQNAVWSFKPYTNYIQITNKCKTVPGKATNRIIVSRNGTSIYLGGRIGKDSRGFTTEVAINDPGLFTGAVFGRKLAEKKIYAQNIARLDNPPNYKTLHRIVDHRSPDLKTTVRITNSRSQNFYAEMLLKYLGYVKKGKGTFKNGTSAVREILAKHGLDMTGIVIDDGSGLSRKNRISAEAIVKLLHIMHRSSAGDDFMCSLAAPADPDTTLRKRLKGVTLKRNVWAKSGYINRVKALSGYVVKTDGEAFIFSLLINNYRPRSSWNINRLQDRLMKILANS